MVPEVIFESSIASPAGVNGVSLENKRPLDTLVLSAAGRQKQTGGADPGRPRESGVAGRPEGLGRKLPGGRGLAAVAVAQATSRHG
jgi:hypothetical protein